LILHRYFGRVSPSWQTLANQQLGYDLADNHISTVVTDTVGGVPETTRVDYVRDSAGGIVKRTVDNPGTTTQQ
jgi:hypothetical protein